MDLIKFKNIIKKIRGLNNWINNSRKRADSQRNNALGELDLHVLTELERLKILSKVEHAFWPGNTLDTLMYLDSPSSLPADEPFPVQGWIASHYEIKEVWIPFSPNVRLELVERPDVRKVYPFFPSVKGFVGKADKKIVEGHTITFRCRMSKGEFTHVAVFPILPELRQQEKTKKLARIAPYLICPKCGTKFDYARITFDTSASKNLNCMNCSASYDYSASGFNFLPEDLKRQFDIVDTENIASTELDPICLSIIGRYRNGLILDCGSGSHKLEYSNVINLEIAAYPCTDIQAVNERLPFQDETFGAVFSFSVLEHVKDPFKSAQEISRVLKRGGMLCCEVPFLQPVHGYPNHFYNMTSQGLCNLFRRDITILDSRVPVSGLPIWTLSWFLKSWADGLDGKTREDFLRMKVEDLISDPKDYLNQDFVTKLPKEKDFELASTTMIIGKKA